MKIEITEGCVCYSYCIDDKEYVDLVDPKHEDYNPEIIKKVFHILLERADKRGDYSIWDRLYGIIYEEEVYEVVENYINKEIDSGNLSDLQDMFIKLVKSDSDTIYKMSGPCECCGDYIEEYILNLE